MECRYVDYHDAEHNMDRHCQSSAIPGELKKKASLLSYFARYMNTHLSASEPYHPSLAAAGDNHETPAAVKKWHRTNTTVVMYLSNGTLQVGLQPSHYANYINITRLFLFLHNSSN